MKARWARNEYFQMVLGVLQAPHAGLARRNGWQSFCEGRGGANRARFRVAPMTALQCRLDQQGIFRFKTARFYQLL